MENLLRLLTADNIAAASAIIGGVISVILFLRNQHIQAREAMLARYDAISQSYIDYQKLCLEDPALGTSAYQLPPNAHPVESDPLADIKRKIHFDIMTSMFERAYLTYSHAPRRIRRSQWPGWLSFIEIFTSREDYRKYWRENVSDFLSKGVDGETQYDLRFERFMLSMLKSAAIR